MTAPRTDPPPIDYEPVEDTIPFIPQMLWWRSLCGRFVWIFVALVSLNAFGIVGSRLIILIAMMCWLAAALCALLTIIYMGRAAMAEVGTAYAARHIVLALALSPIVFIGVWWIPGLVFSDLTKWRAMKDQRGPFDNQAPSP